MILKKECLLGCDFEECGAAIASKIEIVLRLPFEQGQQFDPTTWDIIALAKRLKNQKGRIRAGAKSATKA